MVFGSEHFIFVHAPLRCRDAAIVVGMRGRMVKFILYPYPPRACAGFISSENKKKAVLNINIEILRLNIGTPRDLRLSTENKHIKF